MEREIILIRDSTILWRGLIRPAAKAGAPASARDYFQEAWRQALEAGAVEASDAARVQFRSAPSGRNSECRLLGPLQTLRWSPSLPPMGFGIIDILKGAERGPLVTYEYVHDRRDGGRSQSMQSLANLAR